MKILIFKTMKKIIFILLFTASFSNAQVIVSDDPTYPTSTATTNKAIFDAKSTKSGILLPKVTLITLTPTVAASPPEGTIVYNIAGNTFVQGYYVFIDGKWAALLNSGNLDDRISTIVTKAKSTYNGSTGNSVTLTNSNITTGNNSYFPTSSTNDGSGFAVGSDLGTGNYNWKTIANFEVTGIVIPDPLKAENRLSINANGIIAFQYANLANKTFTYAIALFRQRTDISGSSQLVGTKIFNTLISGQCSFDSFNTNFYDSNLTQGTYKYFIGYKYLYQQDNLSITFGDKGQSSGSNTCTNLSSFSAQQNLIVNLNKIPKL